MFKCKHCNKIGMSEHYMRCVHCYATMSKDELKELIKCK